MEAMQILQQSVESVKCDVKDLNKAVTTELKDINRKFDDFKALIYEFRLYTQKQRLECRNENDERYVKQDQFEPLFKKQMETHQETKTEKLFKVTQWFKNVLSILQILCPFLILYLGYIMFFK